LPVTFIEPTKVAFSLPVNFLSLVMMPTRAYRLIGSYTGSLSDLIELVSLAERGVIKPVVSNRFKLDQATEALRMLTEGKIIGRGVINP
jgi:propanol-preferring alcohol dehydrogenase